jgi:integrase
MATFQKRNGRVTATVRIKPHSPKSKTFDTLRDAKAWAQETEVILKNEKAQIFEHVIFRKALEEYRDSVSVKKKGSKQEMTKINFMLKHMNCDMRLCDVDKEMLVEWRESRLEKVESATVRRELIVLAGFFTWCVDVKLWLKKSPIKEIKIPKDSDHREKIISDEEINILMPYLNDELKAIFMFALETGMRQAEICDLTWERVKLEQQYLSLKTSKNGRPREVPLSSRAIDILKARNVKKIGKVFECDPSKVSSDFMKARIEAELYDFTFHDSRHTAATRIALKIPLLDLCKMFGWSDPKRAMVYYNPTASEIASRL